MTVTVKGFQGTVSDADMAVQLGAHHLATVRSAADLAVTAVSGARQVSVAPGTSDQAFVRYYSDTAQTLTLAPPTSGGKWYMVDLNRQWSPTNSVTLEAVDLGQTTDGTVPTVVPASVVNGVSGVYRNNPGTAGSTAAYGATHMLALVHVRAADATLTIFDMRFRRTGSGPVLAPNFWALIAMTILGQLLEGAVVSVARHTLMSGGIHARSTWELQQIGYWSAVGKIIVDDRTATNPSGTAQPRVTDGNNNYLDVGHSRADLVTVASYGSYGQGTITLEPGQELYDVGSAMTFRWQTPQGTARFFPWDSQWMGVTLTAYDSGSGSTFPIYLYQGQVRFRAGKMTFRGSLVLNAAASFSYLKLGWPGLLPKIDAGSNQGGSQQITNDVHYLDASDGYRRYRGEAWADSQTSVRLYAGNPGDTNRPSILIDIATNVPFNAQWAQSDTITWNFEAELAA